MHRHTSPLSPIETYIFFVLVGAFLLTLLFSLPAL